MAITVKSADAAAAKFVARAGAAAADYKAGIMSPRRDWAQSTSGSAQTWATAVQQAAANGSFAKGVNAAGDAKWQRKAADVGASRYGPGVSAAKSDYQTAVAPYLQVIASVNLPARFPKGDPQNNNRVLAIDQALRQKKVSG